MDRFYANLDVFCLPTFFDGFANVVSEAVAMGIPVACSEFAGSNEIITDGKNGYVFSEVEPIKNLRGDNQCLQNRHRRFFPTLSVLMKKCLINI